MEKLSEEAVLKNAELAEKLAEQCGDHSKQVKRIFELYPQYFTDPASSREEYHGCFPGGLCDHSLRVTKNLRSLAGALAPKKWPNETLNFLGLMHDLGKVGAMGMSYYVPNPSDWHRNKGMLYEINKQLPYMPVCDRTLFILQQEGVFLSYDEYVALRISDGPYEKSNEKYNMKEPHLAVLLHMADRWACAQEK